MLAVILVTSCGGQDPTFVASTLASCFSPSGCEEPQTPFRTWENIYLRVRAEHADNGLATESTVTVKVITEDERQCPDPPADARAFLEDLELDLAVSISEPATCGARMRWESPADSWSDVPTSATDVTVTDGDSDLTAFVPGLTRPRRWLLETAAVAVGDTLTFIQDPVETLQDPVDGGPGGGVQLSCGDNDSCRHLSPIVRYSGGELQVEIPPEAPPGPATIRFSSSLDLDAECSVPCAASAGISASFDVELLPAEE